MFHTFETAQFTSPDPTASNGSSSTKRRTSTVRACEPCRRRKIRCNGERPCETCQWYHKTASCHYTEPRQRQMPSRRSVEKISQTLQEYRSILQKLFPNVQPEQLTALSREKLVKLASKNSAIQPPSPITPSTDEKPPPIHPDADGLEQFQPMPDEDTDISDGNKFKGLRGITDDVNALSLSVQQSSSYLGISSVMAILRVILWLDPDAQPYFSRSPDRSAMASREASSPPEATEMEHITSRLEIKASSAWDEIPLINAYFTYVHPFIPLIDQQSFRDTYMASQRTDSRWQLLLNVVLAMGSMAAGPSEDSGHHIYFARAKQYLDIDTLDSAHLETVQALAILSGFYLHYLQLPNQANALMGATLRIATMLGLHRDYSEGVVPGKTTRPGSSIEMRRRIWWCIFMLDSWVGNTLGRPSMGRMGHAITAKLPQEPIGQSESLLTLVQENIRFCLISTRLEDALAISPLLDESERQSLDAAFVEWFNTSSVRNTTPRLVVNETSGVSVVKNVMRWRYLLSRNILHRPVLLWYAMRKIPFESLSPEKKAAVDLCRDVTADLINDIAATWTVQKPCQMSGWNATWLLYQATMVPLLSLFSDPHDPMIVSKSRAQIEVAMSTLTELQGWSTTSRRSLEVVSKIYEASKRHSPEPYEPQEYSISNIRTPAPLNPSARPTYIDTSFASAYSNPDMFHTNSQEMMMDNMFDSLKWSTSWDSPLEQPGTGWDYNSMQNWAGMPPAEEYFDAAFAEDQNFQLGLSHQGIESSDAMGTHHGYSEHSHSC